MMSCWELLDWLYVLVVNEEDVCICCDISEEVCWEVFGNFFKIIFVNVLIKIGDLLINFKIVFVWLIGVVGVFGVLVGLLVLICEFGLLIL